MTAITAWSAVSPHGIGRAAFVTGVTGGAATAGAVAPDWRAADDTACLVPGFDIREVLGKKGTRSMDRVTALAVAALGDLIAETGRDRVAPDPERTAFVLGTTTGSVQSMMDFTRTSLEGEKPFYVDPAVMPNAVMNCAAGQCAIWHQLKGPNATIAGGRTAGLAALGYARRLLSTDRAARVVCGAAEEFSGARSWLEHHARGGASAPLGEGAAVLLLEPSGPGLAEILAVESRVFLDGDVGSALAAALRSAMGSAGVSEVWAAVTSGAPGFYGARESAAATAVLGADAVGRLPRLAIGDTSAASAAFQIATVLAHAETDPTAQGKVAAVTSVDPDGAVVCALLRIGGQ
ncbi:beta-ketoacyl synthase N-terminal-like domain-containing protein [Actinokineospora sp. 24-640]